MALDSPEIVEIEGEWKPNNITVEYIIRMMNDVGEVFSYIAVKYIDKTMWSEEKSFQLENAHHSLLQKVIR